MVYRVFFEEPAGRFEAVSASLQSEAPLDQELYAVGGAAGSGTL